MNLTLLAILLMVVVCGGAGAFAPQVLRRLPEPTPDEPDEPEGSEAKAPAPRPRDPEEPKELYADLAGMRGLAPAAALASAIVGGLVGWRLGWTGALLPWSYFVPVGVLLTFVDWRTRYLPTHVIAPSYAALAVLVLAAGLVDGDRHAVIGAGLGWLAVGVTYFLLWFVNPGGLGYGDVRLSGLIGIALGYLGWAPVVVGATAGFFVGGFGGALLRIVNGRKHMPYGPFMLLGALLGALFGDAIARGLGY